MPSPTPAIERGTPAVRIRSLSHRYGDRLALDDLSLEIQSGEMIGLLGPNGGGKSTLFRILATLMPATTGEVRIFDRSVRNESMAIRRRLGVVFQHPALDIQLTARENLLHQGHLYGLTGKQLSTQIDAFLEAFELSDRARRPVRELSGGLRRRLELARALVSDPDLLLLDEPTTGLDPVARRTFWDRLEARRRSRGAARPGVVSTRPEAASAPPLTLIIATHLLDEADRCDRILLLDGGRIVADGTPAALKAEVGGDVVRLIAAEPERLLEEIHAGIDPAARLVGEEIRLESVRGYDLAVRLTEAFPGRIESIRVSRPTLDDVFFKLTGHRLEDEA